MSNSEMNDGQDEGKEEEEEEVYGPDCELSSSGSERRERERADLPFGLCNRSDVNREESSKDEQLNYYYYDYFLCGCIWKDGFSGM